MSETAIHKSSNKPLLMMIGVVVLGYVAAAVAGWPQEGAELVAAQLRAGHDAAGSAPLLAHPPYWMIAPFAGLLLAIAVLPLLPSASTWWDSNLHKLYVAIGLGGATILYYLLACNHPILGHWPVEHRVLPSAGGPNVALAMTVLENAILYEFVPFIVLLLSLYTISGGLRIEGDLPAHPLTNSLFLAAGAVLANLIGTTGAAMLLIRPLLETNRERKHVRHTVVFFIFVVCNCGGCLLPLGDPPLFLGYLMGVPFLWTLDLWPAWLFVNGVLVGIYYCWDRFWCYPREDKRDLARDESRVHPLRVAGVWPNAALLVGVVLSVALLDPAKTLPGTDWRPWIFLREVVQFVLVAMSLGLGSAATRRQNRFNYHAILEVAALSLGIFISMQAPLEILHVCGPALGPPLARALLLGLGEPFLGPRQRPDLRGLLRGGPLAGREPRRTGGRRPRAAAGGHQPRVGVHGSHDLYRQWAELHGQSDRREVGGGHAQFLRVPALQFRGPSPPVRRGLVPLSALILLFKPHAAPYDR